MKYSAEEVMQYVKEADVKFIRLAFCDVLGRQKNIAIMPRELERAFSYGIAIDASAIAGFGGDVRSDLLLRPDPSSLVGLPWRSENGRVVRMFCEIIKPDGTPFERDTRKILKQAVAEAEQQGCSFSFGPEIEFYLFQTDESGAPTKIPCDQAGYMDIAPDDKGENIRREICLTLEKMGVRPESSHHEEGPGQNEIDFRYSDPISAADNAVTFCAVVKAIGARNGFSADFSPKPLANAPGSGMHINLSVQSADGRDLLPSVLAGILEKIPDMTVFLNPCEESYQRLGAHKAPGYLSWSSENRSQLIRIPATPDNARRAELRSADPMANPYIAFALLIYAGLHGIKKGLSLPSPADFSFYSAPPELLAQYQKLPDSLAAAKKLGANSPFLAAHLPDSLIRFYCENTKHLI
ncbi:MAG: glutamine synthetase [Oscillospiraceae bacterium]|nr:glutamine synthetase [Oscillospiraceae bacterium]